MKNLRQASCIWIERTKYCYTTSASFGTILQKYWYLFYRGACTFRSILAILTKPSILDISAPFAITELLIKTEQKCGLVMTNLSFQLFEATELRSVKVSLA